MLSRVADSLYWMSRYLERAEHTARVLDVNHGLMIDTGESYNSADAAGRWQRVISTLGITQFTGDRKDGRHVARVLSFDTSSRSSIVSCIISARDNARAVREQVSSEMWEQLNRLFHEVRRVSMAEPEDVEAHSHDFLYAVKEGAHLFQGITDSTMNHGDGWQFIQLGRFMERAGSVATLLDVHFRDFLIDGESGIDPSDHLEWIGLLKCLTAFEAYCKVYTADLTAERIAEFLVLNSEFPHSVRFAVEMINQGLQKLPTGASKSSKQPLRLAGRLRATLSYSQMDEITAQGLHPYLDKVKQECTEIHNAVHDVYISYPVEMALEA